MSSPPVAAVALLRWALGQDDRAEGIVGDLTEEFEDRCASGRRGAASLWFWIEAAKIALAFRLRGRELIERDSRVGGSGVGTSQLFGDVKLAVRGFVRTPGFTLTALLTLALGIGANSAMFSVVHGVLFRPLPYPEADRIVDVWPDVLVTKG